MGFLTDNEPGMPTAEQINSSALASLRPQPQNVIAAASNPAPTEKPRRRASTLDILGGIVDALAEFGGSNPGYREGVALREERERNQLNQDWAEKFNQQKLTKGDYELADARLDRFGQAARGLGAVFERAGVPGIQKALPLVFKQMGFTPEEEQIFAAGMQNDPQGTIEILQAATSPVNNGTQPKEVTIYNMLKRADPTGTAAEQYLNTVATGMDAYEQGRLGVENQKIVAGREKNVRDNQTRIRVAGMRGAASAPNAKQAAAEQARFSAASAAKSVVSEMRDAYGRLKQAGGINSAGQSVAGRIGAAAQENLPLVERIGNPEAFSAREDLDRLRTVGISSLLPILGSLNLGSRNIDAAKELETWRKAIASASDYESAMRALDDIQKRIDEITAEAPAASGGGGQATRPRIRLKPKSAPKAGSRLKYNPATGRIE